MQASAPGNGATGGVGYRSHFKCSNSTDAIPALPFTEDTDDSTIQLQEL